MVEERAAEDLESLVARASAGDPLAFAEIYERYVDQVYRFAALRVGSRELAEDITSETFLRALKAIGTFTWRGTDIGAWLLAIARNIVLDHYKSARTRLEVSQEPGSLLEPRTGEDTEISALKDLEGAALWRALSRLRHEHQEVLLLRFVHEIPLAQVARVLGRTEGAVKALQLRALRALRKALREEEAGRSAPEGGAPSFSRKERG